MITFRQGINERKKNANNNKFYRIDLNIYGKDGVVFLNLTSFYTKFSNR